MTATNTEIKGLADLDKILKSLPAQIEANVVRGAIRAGQKVIADAIVAAAPEDSGDLKRSVRIRFARKSRKFGWLRAHLIVGDKKAWYAHLLEFGTGSFYTGSGKSKRAAYKIKPKKKDGSLFFNGSGVKSVTHPGIRPRPFVRPAFDRNQQAALDAFADYMRKRIPKEVAKAGKNG